MGKPSKPRLLDRAFDDRGVGARNHHVLLIMSRKANTTGLCFMSIDRISGETGRSSSTVSRAISELEDLGRLVEVEGKKGRATRTFRVIPGGKTGLSDASDRAISTGQIDPQNPKWNHKENPQARALGSEPSARRNRAIGIGELVGEQVRTRFSK